MTAPASSKGRTGYSKVHPQLSDFSSTFVPINHAVLDDLIVEELIDVVFTPLMTQPHFIAIPSQGQWAGMHEDMIRVMTRMKPKMTPEQKLKRKRQW